MKIKSLLSAILLLALTLTTIASVPESLPRNYQEALTMALQDQRSLSVGLSFGLESQPQKGQSWQDLQLDPSQGSSAITNALAGSRLSIGIAETSRLVWINLYARNTAGRVTLSAHEGKRVLTVKGGYVLENSSVELRLSGQVWIDFGDEIVHWVDIYELNSSGTGYRYVDKIPVSRDGDTGFYLPIDFLDRGYYFAVSVGDKWQRYYFGPDGKQLPPTEIGPVTVTATIAGLKRFVDSDVNVVVGWQPLLVELVLNDNFIGGKGSIVKIKAVSDLGRFPKSVVLDIGGQKQEYLMEKGSIDLIFSASGIHYMYFTWYPKDDPGKG